MKYIEFNSSKNPTIGVEIELQLVDNTTLDLNNISHKVLAEIDGKFSNRIITYFPGFMFSCLVTDVHWEC